ncbi:sorting nexin-21 isoform X2 [Sceloporus undulatus]|nr:sorting nexin-21 isoform X2 [Sceloporus undulatus]XP_042318529.1 sorting nexin-21 isoform X2 [Sceloporus undulatus]
MASRILHRLRHALTGEGEQDGLAGCSLEAEEFPESSELEDDTEGLSTRLSGTLSFTSNDKEEEEGEEEEEEGGTPTVARQSQGGPLDPGLLGEDAENGEHSPPSPERRGSNMLTRQLQELWRKSRGSFIPQRLLFEVTSASVVNERNSKYVLYTIYLIQAGQFDKAPATISRRYSDFERLNRHLRRRFGADMVDISFPRKRLRRNFTAETIAKRSRAFEQFLSHLHSLSEVRRSAEYLEFFFLEDLREAQHMTCSGLYREALVAWTNAHRLQEKLGASHSGHFLLTLAGLAVCHQELEQFDNAYASCEQALRLLGAQESHTLLVPFLQTHVHLAWTLGKDKREAEARLQGLQVAHGGGLLPSPTLKELLIKQPLP